MKIIILSLFPKMISGFFEESIVKRAVDKKLAEVDIVNLRDFAINDYGAVDDRPYGGGAGMILRPDVVCDAITKFQVPNSKYQNRKTIITSPKGKLFTQEKALEYSKLNHLIIVAGHYEAVDARVNQYIDEEISLGDFVLTGGEIVASAITDSVVRLIPGVLKKEEAIIGESFMNVSIGLLIETVGKNEILQRLQKKGLKKIKLLEYPHYTRPDDFKGMKVPEVLLSGNHVEIKKWRLKKAFEETIKHRRDLLK